MDLFSGTIKTEDAIAAGLDASQPTEEDYDESTDIRGSRSNIIGSSTYDPFFAAQGKVDRGIYSNFQDALRSTYQPSNENIFSGIYNALPGVSSTDQTMFSTDQIMQDLKNKGLENSTDVRNYFIEQAEGDVQTGLNAYGNFLGGLGISKTNPYGEGAINLSDLGAYGVSAATLFGDQQGQFPTLSSYDTVDLANRNLDFLMQGGKPENFGSVSGVVDKAKKDFIAAGKGLKRDLSKVSDLAASAIDYLKNSSGGTSTTDNINMNKDPMPGGGRPAFASDFEVTRPVSNIYSEGQDGGDVYSEGIFGLDPEKASEIMDEPMLNTSTAGMIPYDPVTLTPQTSDYLYDRQFEDFGVENPIVVENRRRTSPVKKEIINLKKEIINQNQNQGIGINEIFREEIDNLMRSGLSLDVARAIIMDKYNF